MIQYSIKIIAQHEGVIDVRVLGGIEQGHVGMLRADVAQIVHGGIGVELGDVTHAEFREFGGVMAEPFAQEGRGSDVLQPQVQRRTLFRHAARPQAIAPITHLIDNPPHTALSAFIKTKPVDLTMNTFDRGKAVRLDDITKSC